jgi:cytoskeletal protein CcmA (bactofilin family)
MGQMAFKGAVEKCSSTPPTNVAAGCTGEGALRATGDVDIAGHFMGNITANRLKILLGGSVDGDVKVQKMQVEGGYTGRAEADAIELGAQSNVSGQLIYRELSISLGATLDVACVNEHQSQERAFTVVSNAAGAVPIGTAG